MGSGAMEALRSLPALVWPLLMAILTLVALAQGHPPPPPAVQGNFSTTSQSWPNSHYYQRLCQTSGQGLAVVTDGLASDAALERTAWTLDMMMQTMDSYVANSMKEA